MKNTKSHQTKLGVLITLGTVLLITALYFIGNRQHIFSKNIKLYTVFQNVNGLQLGNNVRYSGINIGTVNTIEMINNSAIIVQMNVDKKTGAFIRKDAIATIGSDGLVGSMIINIIPGKKQLAPVVSLDTITSYSKIGTDDMLSTLNVTNENAALLTADLLQITNKILKGDGVLSALVSDTTITQNMKQVFLNLNRTSKESSIAVKRLNALIAKIDLNNSPAGILFTDTIAGKQVEKTFFNLKKSSDSILKTTEILNSILSEMKHNDNVINYLLKDEKLPKNIDSTLLHLKKSSKKLEANMEALKHNFLFRGYFRKQEKSQNKNR